MENTLTNLWDTTTLIIEKPQTYEILLNKRQVVRYALPDRDKFMRTQDKYELLRTSVRSQLGFPYWDFTHDELDEDGYKRVAIYVLYPIDEELVSISLTEFSDTLLEPRILNSSDLAKLPFHVIVKFLQADYFNRQEGFAGLRKYFVHAKTIGKNQDKDICLEIIIDGAPENVIDNKEKDIQEFYLTGHALKFERVASLPDNFQRNRKAYYSRTISSGLVLFNQIPRQAINEEQLPTLYQESPDDRHPANLKYHDQGSIESLHACRGYLLYKFTENFIKHLASFGIKGYRKQRQWLPYKIADQKGKRLIIENLQCVYVFDLRHKNSPTTESYINLLLDSYPELNFQIIEKMEDANNQPVLVLLDATAEDYKNEAFGKAYRDPKTRIYRDFTHTPKQSIVVNGNKLEDYKNNPSGFLTYDLQPLKDKKNNPTDFGRSMEIALFQLYLKDVVMNGRNISQSLPIEGVLDELTNYAFIRKYTYKRNSYAVLLYCENDQLQFIDLSSVEQRARLTEIADEFEIDLSSVQEWMEHKYHKDLDDKASYDLILMPGKVFELETIPEVVLYKYAKIEERMKQRTDDRPISTFKLAEHYDTLKDRKMLKLEQLKQGYNDEPSIKFYKDLCDFDDLLDSLNRSTISYKELTSNKTVWAKRIGEIFNLPTKDEETEEDEIIETEEPEESELEEQTPGYKFNRLLGYYRKTKAILGAKQNDVQMSKGIWYDNNYYQVTSVFGFGTSGQDNANSIRRFNVIIGDHEVNLTPFLEATSVKFVRYNQYTVYPYFFYLIDMYIENFLHYN